MSLWCEILPIIEQATLRILTPPMETPDPPNDTPGAFKKVVLTPMTSHGALGYKPPFKSETMFHVTRHMNLPCDPPRRGLLLSVQRTSAALRQSCEHLACLAQHQREADTKKKPLQKTREVYSLTSMRFPTFHFKPSYLGFFQKLPYGYFRVSYLHVFYEFFVGPRV